MGKFTYDSSMVGDFDDRLLAHLQIVIGAKLRRNESFYFSWRDETVAGHGRSTVWMHPGIPLYFKYHGGRPASINQVWIEALMEQANSSAALRATREPAGPSGSGAGEAL